MRVLRRAARPTRTPAPAAEGRPKSGLTTLNRLHCFEVVVEEAGFKRATGRLHITQPALSYQMKQLEQELGSRLFDRHPGGVTLTEAGRLLFAHAKRVSTAVREAERAVRSVPAAAEVRIGTVNSIGTYFLPHVLVALRDRGAAARLDLVGNASEVVDALLANRVDAAILADPRVDRRLRQERLFEERVSLVSGRAHPLFGAPTVSLDQLRTAHFVALAQSTPTGALVREHLDRIGVAVEPVASSDNVESVKRMVEIGLGVAFLPDMVTARDVATTLRPGGALWRHAVEPALTRSIVLVTWNDAPPSPAVDAFVGEVRRQAALVTHARRERER